MQKKSSEKGSHTLKTILYIQNNNEDDDDDGSNEWRVSLRLIE